MKTFVVAAVAGLVLAGASAASSQTDPRKCGTATPGGQTKHAYWCAHNTAVAAVRTVMAQRQQTTRWYAPVFCDQAGTLLRWNCTTVLGGDRWTVTVRYVATAAGWRTRTGVVKL